MKLHDLREFIKLVNQSSIEELEWEKGSTRIVIKKSTAAQEMVVEVPLQVSEVEHGIKEAAATSEPITVETAVEAPTEMTHQVVSPTVGLFYADVTVGQTIQAGGKVGRCTVDALQLSTDVHSHLSCIVTEILVPDGQLVDYGKALLVVKSQ